MITYYHMIRYYFNLDSKSTDYTLTCHHLYINQYLLSVLLMNSLLLHSIQVNTNKAEFNLKYFHDVLQQQLIRCLIFRSICHLDLFPCLTLVFLRSLFWFLLLLIAKRQELGFLGTDVPILQDKIQYIKDSLGCIWREKRKLQFWAAQLWTIIGLIRQVSDILNGQNWKTPTSQIAKFPYCNLLLSTKLN